MSAATKRKYVAQEFLQGMVLPDDVKQHEIVKIVGPRGNNLHEVENGAGERYIVSMPPKFRKNIWIKRGDFVLVEPISEGDRVKAEIIHIIRTKEQISYIKSHGKWPPEFEKLESLTTTLPTPLLSEPTTDLASEESEDDLSDLSPNLNHRSVRKDDTSESDTDSETSSEESETT